MQMTRLNSPASSRPRNCVASPWSSRARSCTDGATNGSPPSLRMRISISLARRLSRLRTRSPAKGMYQNTNRLSFSMAQRSAQETSFSEPEQGLQIFEFAIFSLRINLFHRGQTLGIADVTREGHATSCPVLEAGVVKIAKRTTPAGGAADVTEGPRLKHTAAAIPEIVRVAQAERVELTRYRNLRMRSQNQRPKMVLRVHHVE